MEQDRQTVSETQLSLQTILIEVRNNLLLIIIVTLLFALAGGIYGKFFVKTQYTSKAAMVVTALPEETSGSTTTAYTYSVNLTNTMGLFVKSRTVCERAAELYEGKTGNKISSGTIQGSISYSVVEKTFIINLTCKTTHGDADVILEVLMDAAIEVANEYNDGKSFFAKKLQIFDAPTSPSDDSSTKLYKYIFVMLAIGLVVSVLIIILKIILNDTYKSKDDLERDIPVEVLALVDDLTQIKEGRKNE